MAASWTFANIDGVQSGLSSPPAPYPYDEWPFISGDEGVLSSPAAFHDAYQTMPAADVVDLTNGPSNIIEETQQAASQSRKRKRDEATSEVQKKDEQEPEPHTNGGHTKIGKMNCIICMDSYDNATTAHCGHMFCHECLTRALMMSERHQDRGAGTCPSCRKSVYRKRPNQVIPINFMKKAAYKPRT